MNQRIDIVGIGDDGYEGLTGQARVAIRDAHCVMGASSLLHQVRSQVQSQDSSGSVRAWVEVSGGLEGLRENVQAWIDDTRQHDGGTVLLADGDPLFYGVTQHLLDVFGKEHFQVIPHVSSMQLAFARVKERWDDAYLVSLANEPMDRVVDVIRTSQRVGLFTTEAASPSVVASVLLDRRIDYFTAYVCENLGTPAETVTKGDLKSIANGSFSALNVMVLVRREGAADLPAGSQRLRRFGNPDDVFQQSRPKRGLLTPQEVRCIALAEMDVREDSVVWDVGAGSGSLAVEAANLAPRGQVFAIEMDAEDYALITDNASVFDVKSLVPIHGRAPEAFAALPDADSIFVGGSGRSVPLLVAAAASRLKPHGRLVANVASIDNVAGVQADLSDAGYQVETRMINIARGYQQMDRVRFESLNPSFLLMVEKTP